MKYSNTYLAVRTGKGFTTMPPLINNPKAADDEELPEPILKLKYPSPPQLFCVAQIRLFVKSIKFCNMIAVLIGFFFRRKGFPIHQA